jgi:GT2 family glycosyltransferase
MQPRVTAILVARNGAEFLEHTLAALRSQTRAPDSVVFVDSGSSDATASLLAAAGPTQFVSDSGKRGFGGAVAHGVQLAPPASSENDWIWLLAQDSAPHPRALANLLAAVEIAPSVAVAGPKLMRWDRPDTIAEYGETLTRFGTSVALVDNELDQAQHDVGSDFLGVAATGMLVRRSVWALLGGFDPALPSVDASLDFCVRARLAGHRVVGVPDARILTSGGPELFGRATISSGARSTLIRSAQLHRRLVYSRRGLLPLHWLSLLPLAFLRSLGHLIGKHPGSIGGEFRAAFGAAFNRSVGASRRNLARTRRVGWAAIAPLRISSAHARELRAGQWETAATSSGTVQRTRVSFFSGGGAWSVLVAAVVGVIALSPFLGAASLAGGALAPLSDSVGVLWSHVGYGWQQIAGGFVGPFDLFNAVLAILGSLTFWSPSLSIVLLYLAALPLAALAAWWCAVRFTERAWPPAVAALLWALAPPFLASLTSGHLGAALAHILLPVFVIAVLVAGRSWSAAAGAALLLAAIGASAPILLPALIVALLAWMIAKPRRIPRLIGIFIPTLALFAPLVVAQVQRGTWLAWLADPGVPVVETSASGWHLALGSPDASLSGWVAAGNVFGLGDVAGPVLAAALLAPLAVLALLALFLPGSRRAIPTLLLALLGFATAVVGAHLELTFVGSTAVGIWPGAGLSLFWLGLIGAVVVALDALRGSIYPSMVVVLAAALAVGPLLAAPLSGSSHVAASGDTSTLPAFVAAEASGDPLLGTLQIDAQSDGSLAVLLHRGTSTTLDEESTMVATATEATPEQESLAVLAGNLASRSGFDAAASMNAEHVAFVLLPELDAAAADSADAQAARQRVADALDGNRQLTPIGDTSRGLLWHYQEIDNTEPATGPGATETPLGLGILIGLGFVFFITLLLAVPTSRGRGRANVADTVDPVSGFDEEENA